MRTRPDASDIVVISCADASPANLFVGNAFIGSDIVIGPGGMNAYVEATGATIPGNEDGCYLSVTRDGEQVRIENDFMGNMPIFYYCEGGYWAASNSFRRLAMWVRDSGRSLTPNPPQIEALASKDVFLRQLSSFETVFREIRLLPSFCGLVSARGDLETRPRDPLAAVGYAEGLARFLSIWEGRIGALLEDDESRVNVDISGGIDSRTTLAVVLRAIERRGGKAPPSLTFHTSSHPVDARDREVAREIAAEFGLKFGRGGRRRRAVGGDARCYLSAATMVDRWLDICLGTYTPLRTGDSSAFASIDVKIGGGGGEAFRPFYRAPSLKAWLQGRRQCFSSQQAFADWKRAVVAGLAEVEWHWRSDEPALILHYREFRSRFHSGSLARVVTSALPLQSRLLYEATRSCSRLHLQCRQTAFDIMASTVPRLMDIPFDDPKKQPGSANRTNLRVVQVPQPQFGRVYRSDQVAPRRSALRRKKPDVAVEIGLRLSRAESLLRSRPEWRQQLDAARAVLDAANAKGGLGGRSRAIPVSCAMLTDLVYRMPDLHPGPEAVPGAPAPAV